MSPLLPFRSPAALPLLAAATLLPIAQEAPDADPRSDGTRKMAALLREITDHADPMANVFLNEERIGPLRKRVERCAGTNDEAPARIRLARELLNSNRIDEALAELDQAEPLTELDGAADRVGRRRIARELKVIRAVAWMRRGELENCLAHHCCRSCIFPIEADGTHTERRGSETAIGLLTTMLEEDSDDPQALWLLNLAHMTLGTWPGGVAEKWRVPPSAFASEIEFPRFPEIAPACGADWTSLAGGVAAEDFDGDGLIDLALTGMGRRDQIQLLISRGDGTFENRTHAAALDGICGGLNLIQGDYDNDGDVDLYVIRGAWYGEEGKIPDSLLRNRGDGKFDDVTEASGLLAFHPSQTAVFTDLDGDGWLDLVVGNETKEGDPSHPCQVYVNRRDGTFQDFAPTVSATVNRFVKAVVAGDYDDDGRPDLYFSCRNAENVLLKNEPCTEAPGFRFRDVAAEAGVLGPRMSFPSFFFDYDNDGRLDLYCASNSGFGYHTNDIGAFYLGFPTNTERPCLYHNLGGGRFEEVAKKLGADRAIYAMGANIGDVDNDGWLDFYLGTGAPDLAALLPNRLFRNDEGRRFQDVTSASGTGHLQKGHGVAFADLDNDGDVDLVPRLGGAYSGDFYPSALFENPGNGNHWVTLRLRGVKANRFGVGARIEVRVAKGEHERSIHVVCDAGGSFGASTLQQEIGLGDADRIVFVRIVWPGSGTKQRIEDLPRDRFFQIVEDDPTPHPLALPCFKLGGGTRVEAGAARAIPVGGG